MNFKVIQLLLSVFMIAKLSFVSSQSQFCFSSHEGGTLSVACSSGTAVNFASYGTSPFGTCGAYNTSSCHAPSSYSVVANPCVNQPSCSIDANSKVFIDPCEEALKGLYVQVTCDELKPSIVPTHLGSPTSDPSTSPTTDTPSATPSTLSTRMITNDDFIQAAQVGDLTRLKELIAEWKFTGDFDINATNKVSL
jgi:hypothetical protein